MRFVTQSSFIAEPQIKFQLDGEVIPAGSQVTILSIGKGDNALLCITPNEDCCNENKEGHYKSTRGTVPGKGANEVLYRNRGPGVVRLNRRIGAEIGDIAGVYQCCVPDGCGDVKCIEITLID